MKIEAAGSFENLTRQNGVKSHARVIFKNYKIYDNKISKTVTSTPKVQMYSDVLHWSIRRLTGASPAADISKQEMGILVLLHSRHSDEEQPNYLWVASQSDPASDLLYDCRSSTAQSFSGPSPAGLMTTFYCFRFETPPTWRARSPYLHPPGTELAFRRLLRLARLRWTYSTPPPHGIASKVLAEAITKSSVLYNITQRGSVKVHRCIGRTNYLHLSG
jgi:hypothetical protein